MDGRVQAPLSEWIRSEYGVDYVDAITEPGCDLALSGADRPDLKSKVEISVKAHGSALVFVSGHHDCAANPVDAAAHGEHVRAAVERVRGWGLPVEVHGLWVGPDWKVSRIGAGRGAAASEAEAPPGQGGNLKATFAGGCFWHVEEVFRTTGGVVSTRVGYTGGGVKDPTYEQVCRHDTGHAEAVEVTYDPKTVSYEDLLKVFWSCHNPTTRNRQGFDIGKQYRSAIFCHGQDQLRAATESARALGKRGLLRRPVVTEIQEAGPFYEAEKYHQKYILKQSYQL